MQRDAMQAIAIDGKQMHRAFDKAANKSGLNVVAAFAHQAHLSLSLSVGVTTPRPFVEGARDVTEDIFHRQTRPHCC